MIVPRCLVGSIVEVRTPVAAYRGTLLSCTARSVWLVVRDVDVMVNVSEITEVTRARV